jgi:hypothetical protein
MKDEPGNTTPEEFEEFNRVHTKKCPVGLAIQHAEEAIK